MKFIDIIIVFIEISFDIKVKLRAYVIQRVAEAPISITLI